MSKTLWEYKVFDADEGPAKSRAPIGIVRVADAMLGTAVEAASKLAKEKGVRVISLPAPPIQVFEVE